MIQPDTSKNVPDYCELIVTEKCFFRCQMCNMWKRKHEDTPSLDEWKRFITGFRKTVELPFRLHICGGETLTYPPLPELIKFSKNLGFDIFITTNAFLLNKKLADKLYNAGLREVIISLDSFDEDLHDQIRGVKGSYKKVIEAINNLSHYPKKISINLISILMTLNFDSILPLVKWANNNPKINSINFNAITKPLCSNAGETWYENSDYAYLWPNDYEKVDSVLNNLIDMKENGFKIGNPVAQLKLFKRYFKHPKLFVKNGPCHMGGSVSVNSEGFVFMCHYYGDIGNVKNDDFYKIWISEKSKKIRQDILKCKKNCKMLVNCNFEE